MIQPQPMETENNFRKSKTISTQIAIGVVIVLVGLGILLKRMDFPLPGWLFGWEMILIIGGIISGINARFKDISWVIPIIIGLVFMVDDVFPGASFQRYVWPVGIMVVGVIIAARPRWGRGSAFSKGQQLNNPSNHHSLSSLPALHKGEADASFETSADDVLDAVAVFGGVKRSVVSKQFRGGEIVSVFGGSEINLAHADFNGSIKLEIVNVLGGTKLIVPANWDVQSAMVAVFGGVDDKRFIRPELIDPNKRLIIEGTSFLGGLEIKSY